MITAICVTQFLNSIKIFCSLISSVLAFWGRRSRSFKHFTPSFFVLIDAICWACSQIVTDYLWPRNWAVASKNANVGCLERSGAEEWRPIESAQGLVGGVCVCVSCNRIVLAFCFMPQISLVQGFLFVAHTLIRCCTLRSANSLCCVLVRFFDTILILLCHSRFPFRPCQSI